MVREISWMGGTFENFWCIHEPKISEEPFIIFCFAKIINNLTSKTGQKIEIPLLILQNLTQQEVPTAIVSPLEGSFGSSICHNIGRLHFLAGMYTDTIKAYSYKIVVETHGALDVTER